jgi:predicted nucleic acid-binding protein
LVSVSFDSGVLIALERKEPGAWAWMRRATERGIPPLVSTAAIAEVWRGGRRASWLASALRGCEIAPVTERLARTAGTACGATGAQTVDAVIAATAAAQGATLVTADIADMHALADHFGALRVVALR